MSTIVNRLPTPVRQAGVALTRWPWACLWTLSGTLFFVADPRRLVWLSLAMFPSVIIGLVCMLAGIAWMTGSIGLTIYRRFIRHEPHVAPRWPWFVRVGYWSVAGWFISSLLVH